MRLFTAFATCVALGLPAGTATAQDYTDDELLRLFQTQRDAFREAGKSELGRTRGLTLLTVEDVDASSAANLDSGPVAADGGNAPLAPLSGGDVSLEARPEVQTASADPNAPLIFGALDPELQVNVFIKFAFDSAAIAPDQQPKLAQMCEVMKSSDIHLFRVVGHTDASGPDDYNERLSNLRAREVARYLVNDCGIAANRLETLGLGERFLANPANPRADENRRVEFQALS